MIPRIFVAAALLISALDASAQDALQKALEARSAGAYARAIELLRTAEASHPDVQTTLLLAETLAWNKQFEESAKLYEEVVRSHPGMRQAKLGLARVRLWQGRYGEARQMFTELVAQNPSDPEALEGLATVAYWSGDFRTAQHDFRRLQSDFARKSLNEIRSASRSGTQLDVDRINDDQPFHSTRTTLRGTWFSDPLTRWDASIGGYHLNSAAGGPHRIPFAMAGNETVLPAARLTLSTSLGGIRTPNDRTHAIGSAAARLRLSPHSTVAVSVGRHEIVTNATRLYPFVRTFGLRWQLEGARLASAGAEQLRFSDRNTGVSADGYVLLPLFNRSRWTIRGGASALYRDVRDSRFYVNGISSTRDSADGLYRYAYRGGYDPYWTPDNLVEGRLILGVEARIGSSAVVRLQGDAGYANDYAVGFWPDRGTTPFPTSIGTFRFSRSFEPRRIRLNVDTPLAHDLFLDIGFEHSITAFYEANAFHATVGRRR